MSFPPDFSSTLKPIQSCVHSPDYTPVEYPFPPDAGVEILRRFAENSLPNTLGHNDAIENTGDAYLNMAVLEVLMNHLNTIREKKGYDDRKLNACAAYLHPKLVSNDILARIYHKLDEDWASGPFIRTVDQEACSAWVAGHYQGDPPKVLADLFEAHAWLIFQISRFRGLCAYVEEIFSPLLPTAIASFEVAHQSIVSNRLPRISSDSFDTFFDCIWQFRQNDARQVDSMHVARLTRHISRSSETLKAKLEDLAISLRNGPPVHFRVDNQGRITRIGGMHQCLQLRGRTVLRFFLAKAYDQAYPLSRSAGRKAAGFQSLLFGLTGSDGCLHSLVDLLHMGDIVYEGGTATFTDPLSSRQAAELFFAAIVLLQSQKADQMSFARCMDYLSGRLIHLGLEALEDCGQKLELDEVRGPEASIIPHGALLGRPIKNLPSSKKQKKLPLQGPSTVNMNTSTLALESKKAEGDPSPSTSSLAVGTPEEIGDVHSTSLANMP